MATHKKHKKAHHMRRNAAHHVRRNAPTAAAAIPRAIVVRRKPTTSELLEAEQAKHQEDGRGWRLLNGVGGGILATIAGVLLEHQSVLSPTWMTLGVTGLGAGLALGAPNKTLRSLGAGAAVAGTSLLARVLADAEWPMHDEKKDEHSHVATSVPIAKPPTAGKKPSNATDIPADALARAYERARLRMALASEPSN